VYCSEECQLEMWNNLHEHICDIGIRTIPDLTGNQKEKNDEKFRLLEQLLSDKNLASLVLGTIAEAVDITLKDVYRFLGSSKIAQAAVRRWPKFWYMVWKYKLSEDFQDAGSPNYEQWVKYRQVVFDALFPFTVKMEVVSRGNIIKYNGFHGFRLRIPKDEVVASLKSFDGEDDQNLLEIITRDHLDGKFVLEHEGQEYVIDKAHMRFRLEPRFSDYDMNVNIVAVFIGPQIDLAFHNHDIDSKPVLTHTVDFRIYSDNRNIVRGILEAERKMVIRKLERTSKKLIHDQTWSVFFLAGTLSWPVVFNGNGKGPEELDERSIVMAMFSMLMQTIEDFEESDLVSEVIGEFDVNSSVYRLLLKGFVIADDVDGF